MGSPQWQRAKVVDKESPLFGRLLWVKVGPPVEMGGTTVVNGVSGDLEYDIGRRLGYLTHICDERFIGGEVWADIRLVELLPDFVSHVEKVSIQDFLRGDPEDRG